MEREREKRERAVRANGWVSEVGQKPVSVSAAVVWSRLKRDRVTEIETERVTVKAKASVSVRD